MGAFTFPTAIATMQYGRKTTAVEEKHGLLATANSLCDGYQQRGRQHRLFGLMLHVDGDDFGQHAATNALCHGQPQIAPC